MDAWSIWNYQEGGPSGGLFIPTQLRQSYCSTVKRWGNKSMTTIPVSFWDIPYRAGKLEVVGMDRDNQPSLDTPYRHRVAPMR